MSLTCFEFEELEAAELDEGDVAAGQLDLERAGMMRGAEEHRLLLQLHAGLAVFQHPVDDVIGLAGIVEHPGQHRLAAALAAGPQVLGVALGGEADDGVGGVEDFRRRAVVPRQRDDRRRGAKFVREVEDVADRGGAEGIDRLGIVADHGEAAAGRLERLEDARLETVGILVFVDQHMVEAAAGLGAEGRLREHLGEVEQEIVVIEDVLALLGLDIAGEEGAEFRLPFGAPREGLGEDGVELRLLVDRARIDGEAGRLERKALGGLREAEFVADEVDQVGRVAAVVDGEGRVEADLGGALAQQPRADRVEGARPRQRRRRGLGLGAHRMADDALHPARHLGRRAAREGEEQDAARIGAPDDQVRDAVGERRGLARAGAGNHQQRAIGRVLGGAPLIRIERGEICGHGANRLFEGARPANMIHGLFANGKRGYIPLGACPPQITRKSWWERSGLVSSLANLILAPSPFPSGS